MMFLVVGDAMWYLPSVEDEAFYYNLRLCKHQGKTKLGTCQKLSNESKKWYEALGEGFDLFISHIHPIYMNTFKYDFNTCYYTDVDYTKAKNWVFGHVHEKGEYRELDTIFLSMQLDILVNIEISQIFRRVFYHLN